MKTIEQAKDEAAQEVGYIDWNDLVRMLSGFTVGATKNTQYDYAFNRAMEIYAASQVESKMEEVREKLPIEITPDELQQDYEDRLKDYGSDFASGFSDGGQYYFQLLLEEVKELLK